MTRAIGLYHALSLLWNTRVCGVTFGYLTHSPDVSL